MKSKYIAKVFYLILFCFFISLLFFINKVNAATLKISPSSGTFTVGDTFVVGLYIDTEGDTINSINVKLLFPQNKIQLVSSIGGRSIINIWVNQPNFNNSTGVIKFAGGILNGINTSNGLVIKLRFRIKQPGNAIIKIDTSKTKIMLNDGFGTDVFSKAYNGVYSFIMSPPAGPVVVSKTHPDQGKWYNNDSVELSWSGDLNSSFSYILDDNPFGSPDNISEGNKNSIIYNNLSDGIHYFHIKEFKNNLWGGITTFVMHIDKTSPAKFDVDVNPSTRTTYDSPSFYFFTTDNISGISHYEVALINMHKNSHIPYANAILNQPNNESPLFIESQSPFIFKNLKPGKYSFVVKAYDLAGNLMVVSKQIEILSLPFIGEDGFILFGFSIPWMLFVPTIFLLVFIFGYLTFKLSKKHNQISKDLVNKIHYKKIKKQLEELKKYKKKYGKLKIPLVLLFIIITFILQFNTMSALGEQNSLSPPIINFISKDITNNEIFYIGGRADVKGGNIIIYAQNISTGETRAYSVKVNDKYEWFYRSNEFLVPGKYKMWVQEQFGDEKSAPSPQYLVNVKRVAIQLGVTKISSESIYIFIIVLLIIFILILIWRIIYYVKNIKIKRKKIELEINKARESINRGLTVLNRDLELELNSIKNLAKSKKMTDEEKAYAKQLEMDIDKIENIIGEEMLDIEEMMK